MAERGWSHGRGCAVLVALGAVLLGGTACSVDRDRAQALDTTLSGIDGVDDAGVRSATTEAANQIEVILDPGLDATATLATVRRVDTAARDAGFAPYVLELSNTVSDGDVLQVDDTFARSRGAKQVVDNWIRVVDALLGAVTYEFGSGNESIEVVSGGGIIHDVAEASRIGSGGPETRWRFVADTSEFVVSGRVTRRDVNLFNRVQRTVSSTILAVPARHWTLQRHTGHLLLDLEVELAGGEDPERITIDRWETTIRPLATAAVTSTRYPGLPRFLQLSDVTAAGRDTFAVWSSDAGPVRGRDRYLRGWDQWWVKVADKVR